MQHMEESRQLVIGFVGLPMRGKTYYARKIMHYVSWLGYSSKVFCLANYRREVKRIIIFILRVLGQRYPHSSSATKTHRHRAQYFIVYSRLYRILLNSQRMFKQLSNRVLKGGEVAIYDATNTTVKKRRQVMDHLQQCKRKIKFFWIESICNVESLLVQIYRIQDNNPDFQSMTQLDIQQDIQERTQQFLEGYEHVTSEESSYVIIINFLEKFEIHGVKGYLSSKILSLIMNINVLQKPIYMLRHGESLFNIVDRVGGDSELTPKGYQFAQMLQPFFQTELNNQQETRILTSTLSRAINTSLQIGLPFTQMKNLDEINVGICDGMTYKEIEQIYPFESDERSLNKLSYRYPRGESYLDLINRLEPIIFEIEGTKCPIIIVAHQATLRCLYAYLKHIPMTALPFLSIDQHSVMKFVQGAYTCREDIFRFDLQTKGITKECISTDELKYVQKFSQL